MVSNESEVKKDRIGLLIDGEAVARNLGGQTARAALMTITDKVHTIGQVQIARAYGDWNVAAQRPFIVALQAASIDPILSLRLADPAVDQMSLLRLYIDAVDLVNRKAGEIDIVVVVADTDLVAPLVAYAHRRDVSIVAHDIPKWSEPHRATAGEPRPFDSRPSTSTAPVPESSPFPPSNRQTILMPPTGLSWDEMVEIVFSWIKESLIAEGQMPFTELGDMLLKRHGFRVQIWFGPSMKFKTLMQLAEQRKILRIFQDDKFNDWVELAAESQVQARSGATAEEMDRSKTLETMNLRDRTKLMEFIESVLQDNDISLGELANLIADNVVLPDLSFDQVQQLLQELKDKEVLMLSQGDGTDESLDNWSSLIFSADQAKLWLDSPVRVVDSIPPSSGAQTDASELFNKLPEAMDEARTKSGVPFASTVQVILEEKMQRKLSHYGYLKPGMFFAEAAMRGMGYIHPLPGVGDLFLAPGERAPTADEVREARAVLPKLDNDALGNVLRIIAACEDNVPYLVKTASTVLQIRAVLEAQGGPALTAAQVNKLFRGELPERGLVDAFSEVVPNRETGQSYVRERYRLRRDAPIVQAALAAGTVDLDPAIELQPIA